VRIAVDAMGGDHAPREIILGAVEAVEALDDGVRVVLIGTEDVVRQELETHPDYARLKDKIEIEPTTEVIEMNEVPTEAIRQKRNSSIVRMAKMAGDKQVDAVVSAGNTGACAAACQLKMRRLSGVHRPGIAVVLPTFHGPITICDVGANIAAKPHHLHQYAIMAGLYAENLVGASNPRVALLSIGEEDVKGTELVHQAFELLDNDPQVNFVRNVEGRDLFRGVCDVVVCDGFVGNIVLKLTEGLAEGLFQTISREIAEASQELAEHFKPVIKTVWAKHDYSEYGGAPLLGVDGICIICHGSSDHRAIRNAVRAAGRLASHNINQTIVERLAGDRTTQEVS
jgi:glycerol-3-phosphate acyltransferase PlsX